MDATKTFRIWAQGATDQVGHRTYLAALLPHMKACTDPDFELEFKTMTPSVTTVHALSEFRFSRAVVRGAIEAERAGYDVFFMNHFQDVGLYEARAAVKIPVLGLGEATLLHACTMGRKLGLLAINPGVHPDPQRADRSLWAATASGRRPRHRSEHQRLHGGVRVAGEEERSCRRCSTARRAA